MVYLGSAIQVIAALTFSYLFITHGHYIAGGVCLLYAAAAGYSFDSKNQ